VADHLEHREEQVWKVTGRWLSYHIFDGHRATQILVWYFRNYEATGASRGPRKIERGRFRLRTSVGIDHKTLTCDSPSTHPCSLRTHLRSPEGGDKSGVEGVMVG